MPKHHVQVQEIVDAPITTVFDYFADHQKFAGLFGGACTRIKDGDTEPNGLGSVRRILPGPLSFDETIVKFERPRSLHYRITRGGPLSNHLGTLEFSEVGGKTRVDYNIRFDGKLPGIGSLVAFALGKAWAANAPKKLAQIK